MGLSVQAGLEKASGLSPSDRFAQKKGVWNFEALKTPAFIAAGEFQTPFFGQSPQRRYHGSEVPLKKPRSLLRGRGSDDSGRESFPC